MNSLQPKSPNPGGQPLASIQPAKQEQKKDINAILARMVNLSSETLKAGSIEKAGQLIVNRIHTIVKTDRAVLVPLTGLKRVYCISGDIEPCQDNPFSQAVHDVRKQFKGQDTPQIVTAETWPEEVTAPNLQEVLKAMGGTSVLWVPIPAPGDQPPRFALWLERWGKRPWGEEDNRLLSHVLVSFGYALSKDVKPEYEKKKEGKWKQRLRSYWLWAIMLSLSFLPIQSRVSAPFQVVPEHPYYVFAPFDGIIEELVVRPGEKVNKGDVIFRYDTRVLEKQLEEAQRGGLAVARAELARLEGAAYHDEEARARIPVQKLEVRRREAEVEFLKTQLELSEVRTDADGLVVLDDPDALIGASLQTGQMVLLIADPDRTKLRAMVPVSDVGLIREGGKINVRLDSDPLKTLHARVTRIGFDVQMSDERVPSVLVEGQWEDTTDNVVPGQRGTSSIEGPRVLFAVQFFRKQLVQLRNLIGL